MVTSSAKVRGVALTGKAPYAACLPLWRASGFSAYLRNVAGCSGAVGLFWVLPLCCEAS